MRTRILVGVTVGLAIVGAAFLYAVVSGVRHVPVPDHLLN